MMMTNADHDQLGVHGVKVLNVVGTVIKCVDRKEHNRLVDRIQRVSSRGIF